MYVNSLFFNFSYRNEVSGFGQDSSAMIALKTRQIIFLRHINMYLALLCVIKEDNFDKQGLIDFNFSVLKQVKGKLLNFSLIKIVI